MPDSGSAVSDGEGFRIGEPGTPPGGPAVVARDVVLAYGDHVALRLDALELPAARITAVIGPNGSGKSTLLAAISGLLVPIRGTLEVLGRPPADAPELVAHVLQETGHNASVPLTVREVVRMGRYAGRGWLRLLGRDDREAVDRALQRLSITDLDRRHLSELSSGQRQRVYVAQGLVQEAAVLLLDEPATGLDLPTQRRIAEVLAEEREAGRTIVYTTHDVAEAAEADHVVLLAGRVVAAGPPGDVLVPDMLVAAYGGQLHVAGDALVLDDPHGHMHDRHRGRQ